MADGERIVHGAEHGGDDFGSPGGFAVDEGDGDALEERVAVRGEHLLLLEAGPVDGEEQFAFGGESFDPFGGEFEVAAGRGGAEVEDERADFFGFEVAECGVEFRKVPLGERAEADVADLLVEDFGAEGAVGGGLGSGGPEGGTAAEAFEQSLECGAREGGLIERAGADVFGAEEFEGLLGVGIGKGIDGGPDGKLLRFAFAGGSGVGGWAGCGSGRRGQREGCGQEKEGSGGGAKGGTHRRAIYNPFAPMSRRKVAPSKWILVTAS